MSPQPQQPEIEPLTTIQAVPIRWADEPDGVDGAVRVTDEELLRGVSLSAPLAWGWDAACDQLGLEPGAKGRQQLGGVGPREHAREVLGSNWQVTDADTARAVVQRLQAGWDARDFALVDPLVRRLQQESREGGDVSSRHQGYRLFVQHAAAFRGFNPDSYVAIFDNWLQAARLSLLARMPEPVAHTIMAWDLARASLVVRASYTAGYLHAEESTDFLLDCLRTARNRFADWRQFGDSYLLGGVFTVAAQDLSAVEKTIGERLGAVQVMLVNPDSPWVRIGLHPTPSVH